LSETFVVLVACCCSAWSSDLCASSTDRNSVTVSIARAGEREGPAGVVCPCPQSGAAVLFKAMCDERIDDVLCWLREMRIGSCECGATKVLLCFMHCWHAVERRQAKAYCFVAKAYCFVVVASAEEYSSMRVHIDGKPPDGNAIAFVVIILLSVIALEVLFSRLDTFL
jgi:hypothetical protein